jgi:RHS repeat-associated protein
MYAYDGAGRLEIISDGTDNGAVFEYNNLGMRTKLTYSVPGYQVVYEYRHPMKWLTLQENRFDNGVVISSFKYGSGADEIQSDCFDKVGNRLRMETHGLGGNEGMFSYGYDNIYQLKSELFDNTGSSVPGYSRTYEYDLAGNRLAKTEGGCSTEYAYNAFNQISRETPDNSRSGIYFDYSFDNNGNMVEKADNSSVLAERMSYDSLNRMQKYEYFGAEAGIDNAFYLYGADGLRYLERKGGSDPENSPTKGRMRWFLSGVDVIADYVASTQDCESNPELSKRYFTPFLDENFWVVDYENSAAYWYLHDGLGSVTEMFDNSGNLQNKYRYKSFGESLGILTAMLDWNRYQFTGREYSCSGQYYNRNRWRSLLLGLFTTQDPILSINAYYYASNNPLTFIDPNGDWDINNVLKILCCNGYEYAVKRMAQCKEITTFYTGSETWTYKRYHKNPNGSKGAPLLNAKGKQVTYSQTGAGGADAPSNTVFLEQDNPNTKEKVGDEAAAITVVHEVQHLVQTIPHPSTAKTKDERERLRIEREIDARRADEQFRWRMGYPEYIEGVRKILRIKTPEIKGTVPLINIKIFIPSITFRLRYLGMGTIRKWVDENYQGPASPWIDDEVGYTQKDGLDKIYASPDKWKCEGTK